VERKIESVVKDTLKGMGLYQQPLERVIERFRDPEEWNGLAYKMAWHLADLLKQPPGDGKKQGQQGGQGGDGNQQQKGGGIGDMLRKLLGKKPKDEQKQQDAGSGKPDGQEPPQNPQGPQDAGQEPNEDDGPQPLAPGIAQSLDDQFTPEAERQVVMHYYGKNAGPPACMPLPRVLKLAYEQFANAVEIRAKRPGDGFEMPLTPIRHEPFTPAEHDIQDLDFGKAIIDIESPFPGRVNFSVPADHYTVSHPYTLKKERLPDIMFLFDCSGSMNDSDRPGAQKLFQLPAGWTEDSKYHYALLGAFGAIKWLKAARLAPYVKYNATLFSNSTRTTGWRGYNELEKATELFWQPEFGGTSIRMDVLGKELDTDPSVILMISDGGIDNWGSIKTEFKKKTAKHLLSYIQIKDKTETGKDLAAWGRPVYHIDKAEDLDGLIIDLTKQTYKGHAP
jgi:hypothetical protein